MPERKTIARAKRDKRRGKAPSTQAGEFVREEIEHVREGKHGVRSTKQAIAIGLSKARRAGVELPAPEAGTTSARTRKKAKQDLGKGAAKKRSAKRKSTAPRPSSTRARAAKKALKRESRAPVSPRALSRQARTAAASRKKRGATRKAPARKTSRAAA